MMKDSRKRFVGRTFENITFISQEGKSMFQKAE